MKHTHFLSCVHAIGKNRYYYFMPCDILKCMKDGRVKIRVFGDRYWKRDREKSRIRYVERNRIETL